MNEEEEYTHRGIGWYILGFAIVLVGLPAAAYLFWLGVF